MGTDILCTAERMEIFLSKTASILLEGCVSSKRNTKAQVKTIKC